MAYTEDGFPVEQASKIGHLKLIGHPVVRQLVESFEREKPPPRRLIPEPTGTVALDAEHPIEQVVTIDGGQGPQHNPLRRDKAISFVQVVACLLRMADLRRMRERPMLDPREVQRLIEDSVWYNPAALPLAGVTAPGMSVRQTIRHVVDAVLTHTGLYETLKFLVYREWEAPGWTIPLEDQPSLFCVVSGCEEKIKLPRGAMSFDCPACGERHRLADYLAIGADAPEDWAPEQAASALRDALETLTLFHFVRKYRGSRAVLATTLFVKDGPLLLRAALSRLVVPIRDFVAHLRNSGLPLYLVGIEKTGAFAGFVGERGTFLGRPGDFFLPSMRYLMEEVNGVQMTPSYRNRVAYGAKVAVRIGPDHVLALNVPTGDFLLELKPDDLIGFENTVRVLAELTSYRYTNALVPLVLANSMASISRRPSGDILQAFVNQMIRS